MNKYHKYLIIIALIIFGKLTGLLKDVLITFHHGVSSVTDAYFLSNSISSVLYVAIYSAVPVLIVPIYSRLIAEGASRRTSEEMSAALVFVLLVSLCVGMIVLSAASSLVGYMSENVGPVVRKLAADYLEIMALTFVFSTVVSFYNSIQTVKGMVLPSYMVPVINNSMFCLGILAFSSAPDFKYVLILGLVSWVALSVVNFLCARGSFCFRPFAVINIRLNRRFLLLFFPAALSFYIEQVNGFVGIYFASALSPGAISVFSYSSKINLMVLSVFVVFLTASIFPRMANISSVGEQGEMEDYIVRCLRLVVIFSVPMVAFVYLYSGNFVELIFKRGNFTSDNVRDVGSVLSIVILALPFAVIRDTMNRVIFSRGKTALPFLLSALSCLLNFAIAHATYENYGLLGLAFSAVISMLVTGVILVRLVGVMIEADLIFVWLKISLVSACCAVLACLFLAFLEKIVPVSWFLLFLPYLLLYFFLLHILRVREVRTISESIWAAVSAGMAGTGR